MVTLAILVFLFLVLQPVAAMRNPAAVYCTALGYNYSITTSADGAMYGYCTLPDNEKVDEWKFLLGQTAPQYSYCAKQGYQLQTVNDSTTCAVFMTPSCAVCVLPDGSKTEVTKLMKLDFREKFCLNGKCCDPSTDAVCSLSPPATPTKTDWVIPVIITIGVIAAISVALLLKFRKKNTGKPE